MGRLAGSVAIVTGAAGGIGSAISRLFADEGAHVILTDIENERGAKIAEEIRAGGGQAEYMRQDVRDEKSWQEITEYAAGHHQKLDILVNNAGIGAAADVEHETLQSFRSVMASNLESVFLGTQAAIRVMKAGRGGSIVNMSSMEALIGDPFLPAYGASKAGVHILSKSAALYCAKAGYPIRVNSVHPAYIWTPMVERATRILNPADPEAAKQQLAQMHPVGRLGSPQEVAQGVLYLASKESSFTTGTELIIDGGYTAR